MGKQQIQPQDLHAIGLKVTQARLRILNLFSSSKQRHLSVEEIYKQLEKQGRKVPWPTLYRAVAQFEEAGLLRRHYFDDDHAVYELNEKNHHDHMVCVECGHVEEFCDPDIENRQMRIAEQSGFTLRNHTLYLYVGCAHDICPHGSPARKRATT